ncbi:MAG TPA: DUF2461 domain-containing protein [Candidatus Bathyarchaeia archaeon]|nr:DUF2461 domain-containing protein [Candidatus Bathyarchaeia archaeon]
MAVAAPTFTGFRPEAIQFLADLAANNERTWFQARKGEYERLLKEPLEALMVALDERFRARSIPLRADPAKSPFRIYRDVRFSKDKSPYKTNVGASFPWAADEPEPAGATARPHIANVHSGGGYFHLSPGEIYVGGGIWHPEKPWLDAFRRSVADKPATLRRLIDDKTFQATFGSLSRDGHALQRVPSGYPADHPEAEILKLKDVVFGRRLSDAEANSADLPDVIVETFAAGVPLFRYLASIA